ncbi:MAG: carbohydrate kinase [Lachnospiraceae bacterium]|nr:carbohydrate kinase [Lachnospiraceae bacterium]
MFDITAVGEILIDLTQSGTNDAGVPQFDANPGGAPANLAVAASRLGAKTAFIGKVGEDSFGRYLRSVLTENGVDAAGLSAAARERTTLAVVSLDRDGERSFAFYRDPGADQMLFEADIDAGLPKSTRILHFGSVSLTADPARTATLYAVRKAKEAGALISYDPNYRPNLWKSEAEAVKYMKAPLPMVDILKAADNELPLLTGTDDPEEGSRMLCGMGISLVFVTLGAKGAYYRYGDITGSCPAQAVKVADTNGAGDTFFGAVLAALTRTGGLNELDREKLHRITEYANRAAGITASRRGAIPAMPLAEEMKE